MKPTEMSLFSAQEQTLLVQTERARLAEMDEDELDALLTLVRRARNKYSKLHRRQSAASVERAGKRYAATTSNTRTLRKAEIFEDTLARVSQALAKAARASAGELKRERLAMAASATGGHPVETKAGRNAKPVAAGAATTAPKGGGRVTPKRASSTTAATARRQAARDSR